MIKRTGVLHNQNIQKSKVIFPVNEKTGCKEDLQGS
jgi:hypothetical protein